MNTFLTLLGCYKRLSEKIYVILRWIVCPYEVMEKDVPPKGVIVDAGCGEGVFSIFLAIKSPERKIFGFDLDKSRIDKAQKASINFPNIHFKVKNIVDFRVKCDCVVISDVFHHLNGRDQEKFLKSCSKLLKKSGVLIIKEINKEEFLRAALSRFWDFIFYPADKIAYWSQTSLTTKLNSLGFKVKTKRTALYFPGSTLLYICRKK